MASSRHAASISARSPSQTAFARNLDYYTGLSFELGDPAAPLASRLPVAAATIICCGGLEPRMDIPAVGASIWIDRVMAARGAAA